MSMYLGIGPVAALIAGILILIVPRLLNYIVAVYLIVIGIIGLWGNPGLHYHGTSTSGHRAVTHLRTADASHWEHSLQSRLLS